MSDEKVVYKYTDSYGTKHQVEDRDGWFYDVALISEGVRAESQTNNETVKELVCLTVRVKELEDVAEAAYSL